MTPKAAFFEGVKDLTPYVIGAMPFGLLCGFLAIKLGFEVWHAMALSLFVFAGASQLVGLELMSNGSSILVVFFSALAVNARFLLYSASLAPYAKHWPMSLKIINSATITDQAYALCLKKFESGFKNTRWYTLGCNSLSWSSWLSMTYIGAAFGNVIPDSLSLEFAMPLIFILTCALFLTDRINVAVAALSGLLALLLIDLPYNAGLMIAILSGVTFGYGMNKLKQRRTEDI